MTAELGGNVHDSYDTTDYGKGVDFYGPLVEKMNYKYVRENSAGGVANQKARWKNGEVKVLGVAGNGAVAKAMLEAHCDFLEGPNELFTKKSITYTANGVSKTITSAADIAAFAIGKWNEVYDAREAYFKATGTRVPLLGMSASMGDQSWAKTVSTAMGPLAKPADIHSLHLYPGMRTPENYRTALRTAKSISLTLYPKATVFWLTEMGTWWDNDATIRAGSSHTPTAPNDAILLYPQYFMVLDEEGFSVVLDYELLDEWVNGKPKGSVATRDVQEGRLGTLNHDGTDKGWTQVIRDEALRRNFPSSAPDPLPQKNPVLDDLTRQLQGMVGATVDGVYGQETANKTIAFLNTATAQVQESRDAEDAAVARAESAEDEAHRVKTVVSAFTSARDALTTVTT